MEPIRLFSLLLQLAALCYGSCPFDFGYCEYTQETGDDFDWKRGRGLAVGTPDIDHTSASGTGYYVYIESSAPRSQGEKAQLISPIVTTTGKHCVEFWYHMYGSGIGYLNVYTKEENADFTVNIWAKNWNLGDVWYNARIEIDHTGPFKVIYEGVVGLNSKGDIAIDDVNIYSGICEMYGIECNYELTSMCGYEQDTASDLDWEYRNAGDTSAPTNFPKEDVTYFHDGVFGHYISVSSTSAAAGDIATLISPNIDPAQHGNVLCLLFHFWMSGDGVGALNVKTNNNRKKIWSLDGNLGNTWHAGHVTLASTTVYLVFEVVIGSSQNGLIAIDDVQLVPGTCPVDGTCDFESGMCLWMHADGDDFDWTRHAGLTSSSKTGPIAGHTFETPADHYMYIETSSSKAGYQAYLFGGPFSGPATKCLTFWYNMYGLEINRLEVQYMTDLREPSPKKYVLFRLEGAQAVDSMWKQGKVKVQATGELYKIIFVGTRGFGSTGEIGIDDIAFTDASSCDVDPHDAGPAVFYEQFNCTFENNLCGWKYDYNDHFSWIRFLEFTPSILTGPFGDHTYDGKGGYIYTESSPSSREGKTVYLYSPTIPVPEFTCYELTLFYHMYGSAIGILSIIKSSGGLQEVVWSLSGDQGTEWNEAIIYMECDADFQIILEALLGKYRSDIAVDDMKLTEVDIELCPTTTTALTTELTTEVITTKMLTTEMITTELPTTQILTTEFPTTEMLTTEFPTTEMLTTEFPTTEMLTTEFPTTEMLTTETLTTEVITTKLFTTEMVTTEPLTTPLVTTESLTTPELTTQARTTTQISTTEHVTTATTTESYTTEKQVNSTTLKLYVVITNAPRNVTTPYHYQTKSLTTEYLTTDMMMLDEPANELSAEAVAGMTILGLLLLSAIAVAIFYGITRKGKKGNNQVEPLIGSREAWQ